MKIKFLGTAAAEAIPGVFCACETCKKSRATGGKNIRTRSQSIIDDKILIDLPADTYFHSVAHRIDLSQIHTCLITHSHDDHLYPQELWCRGESIAYPEEETPLTVYAGRSGYRKITDAVIDFKLDETDRVVPKRIAPFVPFEAEGYQITPLTANHDSSASPLLFLIQKDGKSLLYAHDTGCFPEETTSYLKDSGITLDLFSLDCTGGLNPNENYSKWGHHNLIGAVKTRQILKENGNVTDKTICILNHFSHNGTPVHEEMEAAAKKENFLIAFDGYEISF